MREGDAYSKAAHALLSGSPCAGLNYVKEITLDEQQTIKKYKTWLTVVSILLAAVLCVQGIYMAGGFGGSGQSKPAPEETQAQVPASAEGNEKADESGIYAGDHLPVSGV